MKKIDAHVHIVSNICGIGAKGSLTPIGNGQAIYDSGDVVTLIPKELGEYDVTAEKLLELMDKHEVEYAILLQGNYLGFQNYATYQAMKKYPNRFIGAATLDPFSRDKAKIIHNLFTNYQFKIIKMEVSNTSGLMCNHETIKLNGPIMTELYEMALQYNLVFVIDIGRPRNDCYQINELREVCLKYPKLQFVICHLTAPQHDDFELLKTNLELLNLPNVAFDIASLSNNLKPDLYPHPLTLKCTRYAMDILGKEKLMWGTDIPSNMCKEKYEDMYNYIIESNLFTSSELEYLFYKNAKRIYVNHSKNDNEE